jgi:hypothetical protein
MRSQTEQSERRNRRRDLGAPWRLFGWASAAVLALVLVVALSRTETGAERLRRILAAADQPARAAAPVEKPTQSAAIANAPAIRRLASKVRELTLARDRLAARLGELERHLDDLTGSIKASAAEAAADALERQASELDEPTFEPASPKPPSTLLAALLPDAADRSTPILQPLAMPGHETVAVHWPDPPQVPAPTASHVPLPPVRLAAARPPKVEFAVDLGGALTTTAINAQWAEARANFGPALTGLRAIALRDTRFGHAPYRLLAGPLPSVTAAARLCARLDAQRITCRPARFDGEPLAQP